MNDFYCAWLLYATPVFWLPCKTIKFFSIADDLSDVFGKREVKQDKRKTVTVSQLSRQLEESLGKPNNPFLEYSKFDGEVSVKNGQALRRDHINKRNKFMRVGYNSQSQRNFQA